MKLAPRSLTGAAFAGLRIGLLGGSFNPAHDGHRFISLFAIRALRLDRVWWLVSPQNPLKPTAGMAPWRQRLAEAERVARHPKITVTGIEGELGTRYTADTLAQLRRRYPATRFVWLMGADNLAQIHQWRHWRRIFATVPIAVLRRTAYSLGALGGVAARRYSRRRVRESRRRALVDQTAPAWTLLRNPLHPASATAIRRARDGFTRPL